MKIHPNNQLKKMLSNGDAKIVPDKYFPYTNITTYIYTENSRSVINTSSVQDNAPGTAGNTKVNIFFETNIPTESGNMTSEIQLQQQVSESVENTAPEAEPATVGAVIPPEAAPAPTDTEPLLETIPVAVISEMSTEEAPAAMSAELISKAEPTLFIAEMMPEEPPASMDAEARPEDETPVAAMALMAETMPNAADTQVPLEFANIDVASSAEYDLTAEQDRDDGASYPPYISFICFNRLGLTIQNLSNLLNSDEDFELNIIDCNSKDNSWDYIQSLTDSRIKSKVRFEKNYGPIYAINYALARRKPNQYFIAMDSDTYIITKNWLARFMEVFEAFPEVGLLGTMRDNPYPRYLPPIIPRVNGGISYLELKNADINVQMDFIPGQLQCLRPELINEIGYWSEENGFGDAEISPRIVHYTNFKVGFVTTIEIDMTQKITCEDCMGKNFCTLSRSIADCFSFSKKYNKNESFVDKNTWKFKQTFAELKEGARTAYCASIHDPESIKSHIYNADWANDNFNHYVMNSN